MAQDNKLNELDNIINAMIDAGETPDAIEEVINAYESGVEDDAAIAEASPQEQTPPSEKELALNDYFDSIKVGDDEKKNFKYEWGANNIEDLSSKQKDLAEARDSGLPEADIKVLNDEYQKQKSFLEKKYGVKLDENRLDDESYRFETIGTNEAIAKVGDDDIAESLQGAYNLKSTRYLEDLPDKDRKEVLKLLGDKQASTDKEIDTLDFTIRQTDSELASLDKEISLMAKSLENARKQGQEPSQEFFDDINGKIAEFKSIKSKRDNYFSDYMEKNKGKVDQAKAIDAFQRSYRFWDKFDISSQKYLTDQAVALFGTGPEGNRNALYDAQKYYSDYQQDFLAKPKSIENAETAGDVLDVAEDVLANNAMILIQSAAISLSGGGANLSTGAIFLGGYGNKYGELTIAQDAAKEEIPRVEEILKDDTLSSVDRDYYEKLLKQHKVAASRTDADKAKFAGWYGAAEAIPERFTSLRILDDLFKVKKFIPKSVVSRSIGNKSKALGKQIAFNTGLEVIGEDITQVSQNYLERTLGENDEVGLLDGISDSSFGAVILSGGFSTFDAGRNIAGSVLGTLADSKQKKVFGANANSLSNLMSELNTNPDLTREDRLLIAKQIQDLIADTNLTFKDVYKNTINMSPEDIAGVFDLERKKLNIYKDYTGVKNSSLSGKEKEDLIKRLDSKFVDLNKEQDKLLNNKEQYNANIDPATKVESLRSEIAELNRVESHLNSKLIDAPEEEVDRIEEAIENLQERKENREELLEQYQSKIEKEAPSPTATETAPKAPVVEEQAPVEEEAPVEKPVSETIGDDVINPRVARNNSLLKSKTGYNVVENPISGELLVYSPQGKLATRSTKDKYVTEYLSSQNLNRGDRVDQALEEGAVDANQDINQIIADESSNPVEVAEALDVARQQRPEESYSDTEQAVLGRYKVTQQSFERFSDKANVTRGIARAWFNKQGTSLDLIAQEVEGEIYGDYNANRPRITSEDIASIIINNPGNRIKVKPQVVEELESKFFELTGARPTTTNINIALRSRDNRQENATTTRPSQEAVEVQPQPIQEFEREREIPNEEEIQSIVEPAIEEDAPVRDQAQTRRELLEEFDRALGITHVPENESGGTAWWEDDNQVEAAAQIDAVFPPGSPQKEAPTGLTQETATPELRQDETTGETIGTDSAISRSGEQFSLGLGFTNTTNGRSLLISNKNNQPGNNIQSKPGTGVLSGHDIDTRLVQLNDLDISSVINQNTKAAARTIEALNEVKKYFGESVGLLYDSELPRGNNGYFHLAQSPNGGYVPVVVYGRSGLNPNTINHETFGHIGSIVARAQAPELWNKYVKSLKKTYAQRGAEILPTKNPGAYGDLTGEGVTQEASAIFFGDTLEYEAYNSTPELKSLWDRIIQKIRDFIDGLVNPDARARKIAKNIINSIKTGKLDVSKEAIVKARRESAPVDFKSKQTTSAAAQTAPKRKQLNIKDNLDAVQKQTKNSLASDVVKAKKSHKARRGVDKVDQKAADRRQRNRRNRLKKLYSKDSGLSGLRARQIHDETVEILSKNNSHIVTITDKNQLKNLLHSNKDIVMKAEGLKTDAEFIAHVNDTLKRTAGTSIWFDRVQYVYSDKVRSKPDTPTHEATHGYVQIQDSTRTGRNNNQEIIDAIEEDGLWLEFEKERLDRLGYQYKEGTPEFTEEVLVGAIGRKAVEIIQNPILPSEELTLVDALLNNAAREVLAGNTFSSEFSNIVEKTALFGDAVLLSNNLDVKPTGYQIKSFLDTVNLFEQEKKIIAKGPGKYGHIIRNIDSGTLTKVVAGAFNAIAPGQNIIKVTDIVGKAIEEQVRRNEDINLGKPLEELSDTASDRLRRNTIGWLAIRPFVRNGLISVPRSGWGDKAARVLKVLDETRMDNLINGARIRRSESPWKEVYVESNPPEWDGFKRADGATLITKGTKKQRENINPKVFETLNRLQSIRVKVDPEMQRIEENVEHLIQAREDSRLNELKKKLPERRIKKLEQAIKDRRRDRRFSIEKGKEYAPHNWFTTSFNMDKDGRVYANSRFNHMSYKGTDAKLLGAEEKELGKEGFDQLLINAQSEYGYAGDTEAERLAVAKENIPTFVSFANDPIGTFDQWYKGSDSFINMGYYKTIRDAVNNPGGPAKYKTGIRTNWDASTSVIQITSLLVSDEVGARLSNLTGAPIRYDGYSAVGEASALNQESTSITEEDNKNLEDVAFKIIEFNEAIEAAAEDTSGLFTPGITPAEQAKVREKKQEARDKIIDKKKKWLEDNKDAVDKAFITFLSKPEVISKTRAIMKSPVMTTFYGAGPRKMSRKLLSEFELEDGFELFNDQFAFTIALEASRSINDVMGRLKGFMNTYKKQVRAQVKKGKHPSFELPVNGFIYDLDVKEFELNDPKTHLLRLEYPASERSIKPNDKGISYIRPRFIAKEVGLDLDKILRAATPTLVQSIDAQLVAWTQLNLPFDVLPKHDNFSVHPADAVKMKKALNKGYLEISTHEGGLLKNILEQSFGKEQGANNYKEYDRGTYDAKVELPKAQFAFSQGKLKADLNDYNSPYNPETEFGKKETSYNVLKDPRLDPELAKLRLESQNVAGEWYSPNKWARLLIPPQAEDYHGLVQVLPKKLRVNHKKVTNAYIKAQDAYIKRSQKARKDASKAIDKLKRSGFTPTDDSGVKDGKTALSIYQATQAYVNGETLGQQTLFQDRQTKALERFANKPAIKNYINALTKAGILQPGKAYDLASQDGDLIRFITKDLYRGTHNNFTKVAKEEFNERVMKQLFTEKGKLYVEALDNALKRMSSGRVNNWSNERATSAAQDWMLGAVGNIMFLNFRSAGLQLLSTANYSLAAKNPGVFMAQLFNPSTWSQARKLFNDPYLRERRARAGFDYNAEEINRMLTTSKNFGEFTRKVLKAGFVATAAMDSVAIAWGGAAFIKAGGTRQEWINQTEEAQQSSRPDRVSQWQTEKLSKFVLAFANTPQQYFRLSQKAYRDILADVKMYNAGKKSLGDTVKTLSRNMAKIGYYMAVQNMIFSSLQYASSALFGFNDDDDNEEETNLLNSMSSSILRGMGLYGAIIDAVKNIAIEADRQSKKPRPRYVNAALKATTISPPLNRKMSDLLAIARAHERDDEDKWLTSASRGIAFRYNLPTDWAHRKFNAVNNMFGDQYNSFEKTLMLLGWSEYNFKKGELKTPTELGVDFDLDLLDLDLDAFNDLELEPINLSEDLELEEIELQ